MIDFNESPSNVHILPHTPNPDAMRLMLEAMFHPASKGMIELSWTSQAAPHGLNSARMFGLDQIDELVDEAVRLNKSPNRNLYISAGLRRENCQPDKRAKDEDVIAVSALKIDFDQAGTYPIAMQIMAERGLLPNMVVITGRQPHVRAHAWFLLDEPADDLDTVRYIEERFAHWLGGDPSIVNPSRVMRLGGSVAWPLKGGRILETTEVITKDLRAAPWTIDELAKAARDIKSAKDTVIDFNTARPQSDTNLSELIRGADEPGNWHRSTLRAIAHMIARGTPADIIVDLLSPTVVQPGYTLQQTREEVTVMVEGALRKGFAPEAPDDAGTPQPSTLAGQWIEDIEYAYEPELVEGLIPNTGVGVLFGPSSAGKSFIAVDWAVRMAADRQVLDRHTVPAGVLYFAAEGHGGLRKRIYAARRVHCAEGHMAPFNYLPAFLDLSRAETGDVDRLTAYAAGIAQEMEERGAPLRVIIVDTLAAAAPSADENVSRDMGPVMLSFHRMAAQLGCVVILVAHTGKDVARGLRGWSGIRANVDFAIECRVDKDEETGETTGRRLWFEKCKDGPDGFVLAEYHLKTVFLGPKPSGEQDTTCWVDYSDPPKAPSMAEVRAEQEARSKEKLTEKRQELMEILVDCLSQNFRSKTDVISLMCASGAGRNAARDLLTSLAPDEAEGVREHWFKGAKIVASNSLIGSRVFSEFQVLEGE